MPGPVSDQFKGPGDNTPYVPTWMEDGPKRKPTQCASCPYMLPSGFDRCPNCPEDRTNG